MATKELEKVDEAYLLSKIEKEADVYYRKYKPYMKLMESVSHWKKFKSPTAWDYRALGKMLESVDDLIAMCEANGSVADLGILPRIAKDVVTIMYGVSPLPLIASVQPIEEELGLIYYKRVKAVTGGGNITAGDTIVSVYGDYVTPQGYTNAEITESIGTGDGEKVTFTATLAYKPIRPGTVVIQAGTVTGQDYNYDGNIFGAGIQGTVDYQTGAIEVTFSEAPAEGVKVSATYWGNIEDLTLGVREISYELDTKQVRAKIYAVKGLVGLFKSWQLQKRFGISAEEELAADLVNALNSEILGDLIRKMNNALPATVSWSVTPPTGTDYFLHYQTFKFFLAAAEKKLVEQAKRGIISFIIAGTTACAVIKSQLGWRQLFDGRGMFTAHLYGEIEGIPVIRVVDNDILAQDMMIIGYKGASEFEAPAVFCPYMPVTVTTVLPTTHPLVTQRAAATWAAVEVLVNRFLVGGQITGTYPWGES
jgi:hypothetical protein